MASKPRYQSQQQPKQNNTKLFGYYAVKYLNGKNTATYKMRNPTDIQHDYFENAGDTSKFKMTTSRDRTGDTLLYLEGEVEYLNDFMSKRIVMFEKVISTMDWKEQHIKQLIEFTNKKHDNDKSYYSILTHQKYMTDLEVYINYNYEIEEMTMTITAPAWKAVTKTDNLIDNVVHAIQTNIFEKTTPLYKDIIGSFMSFNNDLNKEHPSSNANAKPRHYHRNDSYRPSRINKSDRVTEELAEKVEDMRIHKNDTLQQQEE